MSVCRTCLADSAEKDITEMELNGKSYGYKELLSFCLDIEIPEQAVKYTKLCLKCYRNVLLFYEFKTLAQKNDLYWRTVEVNDKKSLDGIFVSGIKSENITNDSENITNDSFLLDNNDNDVEFADTLSIKEEAVKFCESDDELLSVIKLIKYENSFDDSKENKPDRRKKRKSKKEKTVDQICEECGKTVRNLKIHMIQHQPEVERKKLKCKVCDKTFLTASARCKHYNIKHLGLKKKCNICNKEVVCLWSHKAGMHGAGARAHVCAACGRRFGSRARLAAHAHTHSAARPYACDQCDKAFGTKILMVQHRRQVHDKERSHLCQFCSKSFFKKYHLQVHLRSHSKEKPYECGECGKWFSSSTTLRNHRLLHSGTKSHECPQCAMAFTTKGYLRNHMVIHSKVKKHPCKYCGVRFVRSDHRKRHERTAHEKHILPPDDTFVS